MVDPITQLGGPGRDFPSTCWSRVLQNAGSGTVADSASVEELARRYWKPIYAYIRRREGCSNEDAKDLTQDFFVWMMESDFLSKADPSRGRFRSFVKVALQRYLGMEDRKERALKRGGGRPVFSIGGDDSPDDGGIADPASLSPEELLDLEWKRTLFGQAVEQLKRRCEEEGKALRFALFRDSCLDESAGASYRELASRHGVSESDVTNHLHAAKIRFREILAGLIAETTGSDGDLDEELRSLFGEERR